MQLREGLWFRPPKSCKEEVSFRERSKPKSKSPRKNFLYLSWGVCSEIMMFTACKVLKKGYILLEIDFQSHVFGYLITRVRICSLPGTCIKGHPCDPNEATHH